MSTTLSIDIASMSLSDAAREQCHPAAIEALIGRFIGGDWGAISSEGSTINDDAIQHQEGLVSAFYPIDGLIGIEVLHHLPSGATDIDLCNYETTPAVDGGAS